MIARPDSAETSRPLVLVIEDDPDVQKTLVKLLVREGFAVRVAPNGLEALRAIERERFRALVCDIRMPRLGGVGFFEQLEQLWPTVASRVVFVTAYAHAPEIEEFLKRTGQPVFEKPYDADALMNAVRRMALRRDSGESTGSG